MSFIKENQLVFENSSDSIIVLQDGLLKYINSNGFKIIGYESEEIINHHFTKFVYKEDISLVESRYKQRLNNEPIPEVYPFRLVSKTGENVWFEIHAIEIVWEERPAHQKKAC
ncbi:MAG: PAS domain S-box protein [Desulforegulaceae bacterium]|nr:PAS domain S-box protein [Desulforegulaceae bacterium]